nr:hypothetical protein [Tanacetum cinerariifolium]
MQGTSLTKQGKECKLYDAFDKFTHIKRESLHKYYLRFTQLINDMDIYNMKMEQFQVNTKFLNSLLPDWSKFVTDVKLVKDLHTTNIDQLHAYLKQDNVHANEVCLLFQPSYPYQSHMNHQTLPIPQIGYQSPQVSTQPMTKSPLVDSGFAVPVFSQRGRQWQSYSGTSYKSNATSSGGNNASGQAWIAKCYNYQGEGHMARKCTQPKRPRNATWYKDKAMLAEAQEIEDLDTYDSDCDDVSNEKAVLMANISNYGSDVISEVSHSETYLNDMENQKTLILEEVSRSKMFEKEKDPKAIKQKISNKPIDYVKLNKLYEDFGKRFVPQQELSDNFWYHMLKPYTKSSNALPVKIEYPKELLKVNLVNECLKKLKLHLPNFDKVVKIRTTPNSQTEGEYGFKHTKVVFNNEIIPFLKYVKDIFYVFDKDLLNKIIKVGRVFDQMDNVVQQSSVNKQCLEIAKKELLLENN